MERPDVDASIPDGQSIGDSVLSFAGLSQFMGGRAAPGAGQLVPGSRLGDVTIVRIVDEGGMGQVYEGLQGMPCRTVAVKVIRPGVFSPTAAKRFKHEAQILGRLTHPGICRIYSVGLERLPGGEVPYFVMEYIQDALTITGYATQRSLSIRDRVTLFCEACQAVAHGHQNGVIHRDLKPGNILIDSAGRPKIIDFGLARNTDGHTALTTMHTDIGQLVGTLSYMAPEQFDGVADALDVRTDVYALGVVLYELLAGRLPYDIAKRPVYEVARVVKEFEPRSLSSVSPRLRGDLDTIVAKCVEKDCGRRYSSASELAADLGRHLRGEPINASPPRLLDSVARLARRHRLAALATVGVAASLVMAIVGISVFALRANAARKDAVGLARVAADEREVARREKTRADAEADTSRRQAYAANLRALQSYLETKNNRAARQLYARNLELAGSPLPIEMHCLGAQLDNSLAVVASQPGIIYGLAYNAEGTALAVTTADGRNIPQVSTTPEGMRLLFGNGRDTWMYLARSLMCFRVGSGYQYDTLPACDDESLQQWAARSIAAVALGIRPTGPVGPAAVELGIRPTGPVGPAAVELGIRLTDSVQPLPLSPDGRRLAVSTRDGGMRIVDKSTGKTEVVLNGEVGRIHRMAFSPDGGRLVTIDAKANLGLWNAGSGRLLGRYERTDSGPTSFRFSPEGSRLAVLTRDDQRRLDLIVYDTADGSRMSTVDISNWMSREPIPLDFSPDGSRLVTASDQQDLSIWDIASGASLGRLCGHSASVSNVAFSPDGSQIASGAVNGHIRLWNSHTFALVRELIGHDGGIRDLAFSPDGDTIASGSADGTVRVWSRTTTEPLAVLTGLRGMTAAAFSPNGEQLAVASKDTGSIELWNPRTVERVCSLDGAGGTVAHLAYSPDGSQLAAAFTSPRQSGGVRVWRTDTGEQLHDFGEDGRGEVAVAFSPDGERLLTTSADATMMVWNLSTGRRLVAETASLRSSSRDVGAVFGLGGSRIAFNNAKLLDGTTGMVVAGLSPHGRMTSLAVSPDGRILASGMAIGSLYLNDLATGSLLARVTAHYGSVRSISFCQDSTQMVTGGMDGTVGLWDTSSAQTIRVLQGHEDSVEKVMFTPDGRRIITAATDGTVRIWDPALGQELATLPGQRDYPKAVALSPDGTRIVAAATDGAVRIWGLSNAEIVTARRAAAARTLTKAVASNPATSPADVHRSAVSPAPSISGSAGGTSR
jgi:WD40 repeat protein/tRNA A-37 threonylcarbamoyl transferase component Bud32